MRILHFSDFHISEYGLKQSEILVKKMIDQLDIIKSQKKFDLILFTGDMVNQGGHSFGKTKKAYEKFNEIVIDKLCNALELSKSRFIAVPGNHEVNEKRINRSLDIDLEQSLKDNTHIQNHLMDEKRNQVYKERLSDYNDYYRQPWLKSVTDTRHEAANLADHIIIESDNRKIGISLLNTAWRCSSKKIFLKISIFDKIFKNIKYRLNKIKNPDYKLEENKVILGTPQIYEANDFFKDNEVQFKIALAHHHYNLLNVPEDSVKSQKHLFNSYQICFFGHTHKSNTSLTYRDDNSKLLCTIAPGIISWNIENPNYKNGFEVWDIDLRNSIATESRWIQDDKSDFIQETLTDDGKSRDWFLNIKNLIEDFKVYCSENFKDDEEEIPIPQIGNIVESILSPDNNDIILFGASGIGKTHLLKNLFFKNSDQRQSKVYYCEKGDKLLDELNDKLYVFFKRHKSPEECIIIDNSNPDVIRKIKEIKNRLGSKIKLLGVCNNIKHTEIVFSDITILGLGHDKVKEGVNAYINEKISDPAVSNLIKKFADGFPKVALKLISQYQVNQDVNLEIAHKSLSSVYDKFKDLISTDEDLQEMLQAMALFQPFPKLENESMAIWKCRNLSNLYAKSENEIVRLLDKAKQLWNGELIDETISGYSIRPYPLAIRLAQIWFLKHNNPQNFVDLLDEFKNLDIKYKDKIIGSFTQRLSQMNGCVAAEELLDKLNGEFGVFRNENVAFSEVGSQLILAISDVSPKAVSEALKFIFLNKTSEEIIKIPYYIRRNIVSSLSKLIFYKESFNNALYLISLLAINETEDHILNNSTGILEQIFHAYLPGTEVSLKERVKWIEENILCNHSSFLPLLPKIIRGSLASGHFSRIGNVGPSTQSRKDYVPSPAEFIEYFSKCIAIAVAEVENGRAIKSYSDIVDNNIHLWLKNGLFLYAFPLIKAVSFNPDSSFKLLEYDFNDILSTLNNINKKLASEFNALRFKIVPFDFLSRLKSIQQEFYSNSRSGDFEEEKNSFKSLAEEFVNSKLYKNQDELSSLLTSIDFYSFAFNVCISEIISDDKLCDLYEEIVSSPVFSDELISPFLMSLCSLTRNWEATQKFKEEILKKGFLNLYTIILARSETDELSNFGLLEKEFSNKFNFLPLYLDKISLSKGSYDLLSQKLIPYYKNNARCIGEFFNRHYSYSKFSPETGALLKEYFLNIGLNLSDPKLLHGFVRLIIAILEQKKDEEFASQVLDKFLHFSYEMYDELLFTDLFKFLSENYPQTTIEPLILAMASSHPLPIPERMKISFGINAEYGEGILFDWEKPVLMTILQKHGLKVARVYARLCPVYNNQSKFSDWTMYLLDNYGKDSTLKTNLTCHIGSFSWIGSVIPLYTRQIKAFEGLINHPYEEVRDWASSNLKSLKTQIYLEEVNEDYAEKLYF